MTSDKRYILLISIILFLGILFLFSIPGTLFKDPLSTVITSADGELLGAKIAPDGQWRFPEIDSVPEKFKASIIQYEDRFFYKHPGFNPFSLVRALILNIKAGKTVSGGSTITMQTIRLSRKGKPRTIREKIIEIYLAVCLETKYTKEQILATYSSYAPFGGNVVGLEAASWRYYNCSPWDLSWAESASLAVLPNSPSLVHPGRNKDILKEKRDNLLKKLCLHSVIDLLTYSLALLETIPEKPEYLPMHAPHLLERMNAIYPGSRIRTTINLDYQEKLNRIITNNKNKIYANHIRNIACIIIENKSGNVLAYTGNIRNIMQPEYGGENDMVMAPRSTGSIMKPFLFVFMMDRGEILPGTLIPDIPTRYGDFSPKNFDRGYDGAVPAKRALERSLNIPAVRLLKNYGVDRFNRDLKRLGLTTLHRESDHYGLSLILGGAEANLWELAGIYSSMSRVLINYNSSGGKYFRDDYREPSLHFNELKEKDPVPEEYGLLGAGAIYLTFKSLLEVNRPETEAGWESFHSSELIAWKTGTSFGFRDAWAIGTTPEYVVAVWAGNASGEGRPGLTGIGVAAPLMFEVFDFLPSTSWFDIPYDDLIKAEICTKSGHRAGIYCPEKDSAWLPPAGLSSPACPYHKIIHFSEDGKYRVNESCYDPQKMILAPWFILPPVQEYYYKYRNPSYISLPPLMKTCREEGSTEYMQMVYPEKGSVIYIPFELQGEKGRMVCEAVHRSEGKKIYWHLDHEYLGLTDYIHQMAILTDQGDHVLTLIDEDGNRLSVNFQIADRNK